MTQTRIIPTPARRLAGGILPLLAALLTLTLSGCAKARFSISFDLDPSVNTSYRLQYYAASKKQSLWMEAQVFVKNGKAEQEATTVYPAVVYLFVGSETPSLCFYAERGDKIKITGNGNNPAAWDVDGNRINREWSQWRKDNLKILEKNNPQEINAAIAKYVRENPDKKLSLLLLATTFIRNDDDMLYRRLWDSLSPDLKDDEMMELVNHIDESLTKALPPLPEGVFRTCGNGCDTLRPAKARASIIFFWRNSDMQRRTALDSLRSLARAYPDSVSRNIVDICMEPDSISWVSGLQGDSLSHTLRVWMPLGPSDKWAVSAAPLATPSFIVADSKGIQIYRGANVEKAALDFRKLMKQHP